MSTEPINTVPIQQFIKQVQGAENSRAKEIRLDINAAKNLSYTLGIVMARLNGDLEQLLVNNSGGDATEVIEIKLDQGNW